MDRFLAFHRVSGPIAPHPDGRTVYALWDVTGAANVWAFRVDGPPRQVTPFGVTASEAEAGRRARSLALSPSGARLLVSADVDGREDTDLYRLDGGDGWPERLTTETGVQWLLTPTAWHPRGELFAVAANRRRPGLMDAWVWTWGDAEPQRIPLPDGYHRPAAWSPNGRFLSGVTIRRGQDTDIWVWDREASEGSAVLWPTRHDGEEYHIPGPWAADSQSFWCLTDAGRDFMGLRRRWLDGRVVAVWDGDGDVEDAEAFSGGIMFQANEQGNAVWRLAVDGSPPVRQAMPPQVVRHMTTDPTGQVLWAIRETPHEPSEVCRWEGGSTFRPASQSFFGGRMASTEPELVAYESQDGTRISAWWYASTPSSPAAVMVLHGGPEAQERPRYSATVQSLRHAGLNVLVPNGRGSTGFGRSFQRLVYGDWGGGDLDDVLAGAAFIRQRLGDGASRIGLFGASYGGFLVLSALTRRAAAEWAGGVAIDAPSDLPRFVATVPATWKPLMGRLVGDPERDRATLIERSPLTHAAELRAPLLLLHGANDPRVAEDQSATFADRLRLAGKPVTYRRLDGEGHGFGTRQKSRQVHLEAVSFLLATVLRD